MDYDLPLSVAFKLFPNHVDPRTHLVTYRFTEDDVVEQSYDSTLYRLPYSPETFWTHFRFGAEQEGLYHVELLLLTTDGDCVTLTKTTDLLTWHSTDWPLPSFPLPSYAGLYFRVIYPAEHRTLPAALTLLGFARLFPASPAYLLSNYEPVFLFVHDSHQTIYRAHPDPVENAITLRPLSHVHREQNCI